MPTITLTAKADLLAAADGQPRRFRVDPAYSGGTVPGYTARADLPIVIDLATLTTRNENIVANLDHKVDARVGHVDEIQNDSRTLKLAGVVSAATSAADEFLASAAKGFPWAASIESELPKLERIERGQQIQVNGQSFAGPLYVARGARLTAVAFVSTGADPAARAFAATRKVSSMNRPPYDHDPFVTAQLDECVRQHHAREAGLQKMRAGLYQVDLSAAAQSEVQAAASVELKSDYLKDELQWHQCRCLAGEITMEELQNEIRSLQGRDARLAKLMPADAVASHGSSRGSDSRLLVAALCLKAGLSDPEKHFDERLLDAADRASRGLGLQALLMTAACGNGYQARPGEYVTDGNLRQVLTAAFRPDLQASGFSTLNIGEITSNVANKFLLDGFNEVEDPWQKIAAVKSVRNFKEHTFVRLLDSLEYEQVGSGGEIPHGTLANDKMTAKADTYAKMLTITRQDIINDDLSALTDVPRRLGRAAMMKFRRLFWTAFLASDSFFDATNGNVVTGAGTALDVEGIGLTAGLKAFRAQKTPEADGAKLIGGRPAVLMVPPSLEIAARRILTSTGIVSGTDGMIPAGNPFQGLAELVVADWIGSDSGIAGGDDDKWYLLRSPSFAPAMLVAALNGRVEPTVETAQADFNVLGIEMRGYNDVGFARGEKLCGLQMAGTPGGG